MSFEANRENLVQSHVSLTNICTYLPVTNVILLGKLTRFWHISYNPAMKAQASLRNTRSRHSLHSSHTQSMVVDEHTDNS